MLRNVISSIHVYHIVKQSDLFREFEVPKMKAYKLYKNILILSDNFKK